MEKPHKIVISIVAVALYCLAAGGFSNGINHSVKVDQNIETTGSRIFVAEELSFLAGFAVKETANQFSGGGTYQISLKQRQLQKAVVHALEVQVACAIFQYVLQFHINPVRLRKSDMLFPFHYFFEPVQAK